MTSRGRRLAGEIWRYLAVGLGATIVAVILFNGLVHGFNMAYSAPLNAHPILGYVIANLIGTAISYRGTRLWAFRHRTTTHPDGGRTAFVIISVATMAIPMACLWISRKPLANAARFVLTRQFVFGVHAEAEALDRV